MKIYDIKINHMRQPLGFNLNDISISFKVGEAKGKELKSVRICVSDSELIYDSGTIFEIRPVFHIPIKLKPRTGYQVEIFAKSDTGESAVGESSFETGKMQEPWLGRWITHSTLCGDNPIIAKKFHIDKEVKQARMYVGCCGLYAAFINGIKVGNEYLTPYCNSYEDWMQVITHDVTDMLALGENSLEFKLASGWYKGRFGFEKRSNIYGDTLAIITELNIRCGDDSETVIVSDKSWCSMESEYESADIYNGVVMDFTRKSAVAQPVNLLERDNTKLTDRLSLPVTVKERRKAFKSFITPKGEKCIDMEQNMVGWLLIDTAGFPDKDLRICFFEITDKDGNVYTENLRSAKQEFIYKTDGKARVIEPEFTYYGFRYAQIEGLDEIDLEAFTGCVVYSDISQTGSIVTSNFRVNRLFQNALWGQKGNFVDVPTDCPQRDERLGWTGDAQVFCATACYNMDSFAFFNKYMYDMLMEQRPRGGGVPNYVPSFEGRFTNSPSSSAWGDAAVIIPWTTYVFSGDIFMLSRQYESMKSWVDYIGRQVSTDNLWENGFHFGDWLAMDTARPEKPFGATPNAMVASAYYLYSVELTSKAAKALGYLDDEKKYTDLAAKIKKAMIYEFVTPSGRLASDSQTANVIALYMGFANDREKTARMLNEKIEKNDGYLNTGFVGTAYLCRVLSENGFNDTAYRLLMNRGCPSWLYQVDMGATTIWERWNSLKPDGSPGDMGMNSYNHYSYGAVVEWIYRNAAGIAPMEECPGFRKIRLAPQPNPRLEWLSASYDSPCGTYRSKWQISEEDLKFSFEIPFGGEAELHLPDAPNEIDINCRGEKYTPGMILKKGLYEVSYKPTKKYYMVFGLDSPAKEVLQSRLLRAWLEKNLDAYNKIPKYIFNKPAIGSIGKFLEDNCASPNENTAKKLVTDWAAIRSWDINL